MGKKAKGILIIPKDTIIEGGKLSIEAIWVDSAEFRVPVRYDGQDEGVASFYNKDGAAYANIEFEKNTPDYVFDLYPTISGSVEEFDEDTGAIKKFNLIEVSLVPNPPREDDKTIGEQKELHDAKVFAAEEVARLRKKGWSERRIERFFFNKYKIKLT